MAAPLSLNVSSTGGTAAAAASSDRHLLLSLTSIVHKNLQHQADWSFLTIHDSPNYPRPLISGIPPEPIYIEPEEEKGEEEEKEQDKTTVVVPEWVLPVDLREKWSLRKWAEVFDSIDFEPPPPPPPRAEEKEEGEGEGLSQVRNRGRRRKKKRLVMAIVSSDSTVVYYIVHDGIVKPRQN